MQPVALAPPPTPAPEVAGAPAPGAPAFSAYPPPPPPAGDKESPPPPPPEATAAAAEATPAPLAASGAPSASTSVTRRIEPPASRGPGPFVMLAAGALLFAGGYVAGPAYLYGTGSPGDNSLSFIPIAGPLLVASSNPFLSTLTSTWIYAIAATAAGRPASALHAGRRRRCCCDGHRDDGQGAAARCGPRRYKQRDSPPRQLGAGSDRHAAWRPGCGVRRELNVCPERRRSRSRSASLGAERRSRVFQE